MQFIYRYLSIFRGGRKGRKGRKTCKTLKREELNMTKVKSTSYKLDILSIIETSPHTPPRTKL